MASFEPTRIVIVYGPGDSIRISANDTRSRHDTDELAHDIDDMFRELIDKILTQVLDPTTSIELMFNNAGRLVADPGYTLKRRLRQMKPGTTPFLIITQDYIAASGRFEIDGQPGPPFASENDPDLLREVCSKIYYNHTNNAAIMLTVDMANNTLQPTP